MTKTCGPSFPAGFPIRGWFADSRPDFRRELLALARPKFHAAGSVIYQAGEFGQDVFGISSGVVTLQSRFTHPDAALLHMLRPGEWFGTVPVLLEQSRRVTAAARTDANLLRVPGDELRALLRRRPEWFAELGRDAISNMDLAMQIAVDLLIRDASARCAAVLLRLAALQRLQEYVQPRRERVLEPSTRDPQLQVADRERPFATACRRGCRLRTSRRSCAGFTGSALPLLCVGAGRPQPDRGQSRTGHRRRSGRGAQGRTTADIAPTPSRPQGCMQPAARSRPPIAWRERWYHPAASIMRYVYMAPIVILAGVVILFKVQKMRYVYMALIVILAGVVILFTVQNFNSVTVALFSTSFTMPASILVLAAYVLGMLTGGFMLQLVRSSISGAKARD